MSKRLSTAVPAPTLDTTLSDEMIPYWEHVPRVANVPTPVSGDDNFKSRKVVSLNAVNFDWVLSEMPVVMVMFYRPCDNNVRKYQDAFSQASKCTKREHHVFAAVNCAQDEDVCLDQGVYKTPAYSMYSNGHRIGYFGDLKGMSVDLMRAHVEQAPVFPHIQKAARSVKPKPERPKSMYEQYRDPKSSFASFYEY